MTRGEGGGGPYGNQKATKLTSLELKQEAYRQYCAHIASGKSGRSWVFEHPELNLTARTMEHYLKDEVDFPPEHLERAKSKGFAVWEDVVSDSAKGKNTKANTASLQMVMRNKYNWDKINPNTHNDDTAALESNRVLDKLMSHINSVHVDTTKKDNIQIDLKMSDNNDTSR